jgi:hypothetical protein
LTWKYSGLAAASTAAMAAPSVSPPASRPSVSMVKEIATGTPAARAARTIPIASPTLVSVYAETMSAPA